MHASGEVIAEIAREGTRLINAHFLRTDPTYITNSQLLRMLHEVDVLLHVVHGEIVLLGDVFEDLPDTLVIDVPLVALEELATSVEEGEGAGELNQDHGPHKQGHVHDALQVAVAYPLLEWAGPRSNQTLCGRGLFESKTYRIRGLLHVEIVHVLGRDVLHGHVLRQLRIEDRITPL